MQVNQEQKGGADMPKSVIPPKYYELLEQIQEVDFALVELTLYLDTHPQDVNAVTQFNELALRSQTLKNDFEQLFGPLQQFGNSYSRYPWQWAESPWPWEV
jgi:spore coat protein JB